MSEENVKSLSFRELTKKEDAYKTVREMFNGGSSADAITLNKLKAMAEPCLNAPLGHAASCVDRLENDLTDAYNLAGGDKKKLASIIQAKEIYVSSVEEVQKDTTPASHSNNLLFLDLTGVLGFGVQNRFYLDESREGFSPDNAPCLGTFRCFDMTPNIDLLFKTLTFKGGQNLRLGGFYNFTPLNIINERQPGLVGNNPMGIHRHRAGLLGEITDFPNDNFFVQAGMGVIKYDAEETSDPARGLDVGARSNRLASASDLNKNLGFSARESFGYRFNPFKNNWVGFLLAADVFQDFWRNDDLKNINFGIGVRTGLSFYFWDTKETSSTSSQ